MARRPAAVNKASVSAAVAFACVVVMLCGSPAADAFKPPQCTKLVCGQWYGPKVPTEPNNQGFKLNITDGSAELWMTSWYNVPIDVSQNRPKQVGCARHWKIDEQAKTLDFDACEPYENTLTGKDEHNNCDQCITKEGKDGPLKTIMHVHCDVRPPLIKCVFQDMKPEYKIRFKEGEYFLLHQGPYYLHRDGDGNDKYMDLSWVQPNPKVNPQLLYTQIDSHYMKVLKKPRDNKYKEGNMDDTKGGADSDLVDADAPELRQLVEGGGGAQSPQRPNQSSGGGGGGGDSPPDDLPNNNGKDKPKKDKNKNKNKDKDDKDKDDKDKDDKDKGKDKNKNKDKDDDDDDKNKNKNKNKKKKDKD